MYAAAPPIVPSSSPARDPGRGGAVFPEHHGGAGEGREGVGRGGEGDWQGGDGESVVGAGDFSSAAESKSGATRGERGLMERKERLERAARLLGK